MSGSAFSPTSPSTSARSRWARFSTPRPPGRGAISAGGHFVAYADGFVADSGAWFSRKPAFWSRANPGHDRVALRRVREAVRFVRVTGGGVSRNPRPQEG